MSPPPTTRLRVWSSFALVLLSLAPPSRAAPVEWPVSQGGNGHYYEIVATDFFQPKTWDESRALAAARKHAGLPGHLATITSAAEQAFVYSVHLRSPVPGFFYLGGEQRGGAASPAEGWSWITGEPWEFTAWSIDPPEPNDLPPDGIPTGPDAGNEQHLTFGTFGNLPAHGVANWNDFNGNQRQIGWGYVVEYEAVPEPGAALLAASAVMLSRRRKVRKAG